MNIKSLREMIRDEFGADTVVRQNRASITITTTSRYSSGSAFEAAVKFFLRDRKLDSNYSVINVGSDRVRLVENTQTFAEANGNLFAANSDVPHGVEDEDGEIDFDDEDEDLDDDSDDQDDKYIESIIRSITSSVDAAHEQTLLENLLLKALDVDVEEFITDSLSAVLTLLPASHHALGGRRFSVNTEELENVIKFAYVCGKISNARVTDLDTLRKYLEDNFPSINLEGEDEGSEQL